MKSDPAIEDIRKTRREISRRFGHDTKALIAHYEQLQKKYADRLVSESSGVPAPSEIGEEPTRASS